MAMDSYEYTAPTVDEAVALGLRELGLRREDVEVEVIRKGSRGILGIGRTDAVVRLTPKPRPTERPGEEKSSPQAAAPVQTTETVTPTPAPEMSTAEVPPLPTEEAPTAEVEAEEPPANTAVAVQEEPTPAQTEEESLPTAQEIGELAQGFLSEMLALMGIRAQVELHFVEPDEGDEPVIRLNVVGDNLGMLIGRHGETLNQVQYLIRLMVNQRIHRWVPLLVDVNDYREERAERLQRLALRLADQVMASGRGVALEPMPAADRRQIHLALRDHPHVYTESIGEGDRRKVRILPK